MLLSAGRRGAAAAPLRAAARAARPAQWDARRGAAQRRAASSGGAAGRPSWEIRMLYDGECSLCMKEVNFLRARDAGRNKIDFVDIASPGYDPAANAGIGYATAMEKIHAIGADGRVITGVEVFRRLYEAVGLGWVYAVTKNDAVGRAADKLYDFWARYRTQITGREALGVILQRRAAEAAGRGDAGSLCGGEGDGAAACEVPQAEAARRS